MFSLTESVRKISIAWLSLSRLKITVFLCKMEKEVASTREVFVFLLNVKKKCLQITMHRQIILGDLGELFGHTLSGAILTFFHQLIYSSIFCMHFRKSYLHLGVFILPEFF